MPEEKDEINPDHYKQGGIEVWDFLKAYMTREELRGFAKGNVIKYLARANTKGGVVSVEKAKWYEDKLVELMKEDAF